MKILPPEPTHTMFLDPMILFAQWPGNCLFGWTLPAHRLYRRYYGRGPY